MVPIKIIFFASVSLAFLSTSLSCSLSKTHKRVTTPNNEYSSKELESTSVLNANKSLNLPCYKRKKLHNTHKRKALRLRRRHVYNKHVFRNNTVMNRPEKCTKPKIEHRSAFQTSNQSSLAEKQVWTTTEPAVTSFSSEDYEDSTMLLEDDPDYTDCRSIPPLKKEGRRVADIKCEETIHNIYNSFICPFETNDKVAVVGGNNSGQGDFPHMGAVGWQKEAVTEEAFKYMCGCVLISNKYALTAGHCKAIPESKRIEERLISIKPKIVQFGSVQLYETKRPEKCVHSEIERFIVHKDYKPPIMYNDLALIKFKNEIKMTKRIMPACIWIGDLGNRQVGNVTGWGVTEKGETNLVLKYAEVKFIKSQKCDNMVSAFKMRHWAQGITKNQFCAGNQPGVDTCLGDSGGPIQIKEPVPIKSSFMMSYVVGVTSFGISKYCGESGKPGVYTNISSYLCWIEKEVWPEEHNSFCD